MAVYLRDHPVWAGKTIYVGPMGCRTGMYLIFKGDLEAQDIADIMTETFKYITEFSGVVPATQPKQCGNYLDHNLGITQWEARKFLNEVLLNLKQENMEYPRQKG
jgi:S-ribosylhomocysteine lyase